MKKFRFSLEVVLKVRRQAEEKVQRELAQAQFQRDQVFVRLGEFKSEQQDLAETQNQQRSERVDLNREAWFLARHRGLAQGIRELQQLLALAEKNLDAARQKAVEAARERRVLEKLEEKQRATWLQALDREEQGFMDELAQRARQSFSLPAVSANGN